MNAAGVLALFVEGFDLWSNTEHDRAKYEEGIRKMHAARAEAARVDEDPDEPAARLGVLS